MSSQVHVEAAHYNRHGGITTHGHEEEGCVFKRPVVMYREQDGESSDGYTDSEDCITQAMACLVGNPGQNHGKGESGRPWGYAVQLCLDLAIAIAVDNRRREVRIAVRRYDESKVHKASEPDLVVLEDIGDIFSAHFAFHGRGTLFAAETVCDEVLLLRGKPVTVFGEVGKNEEECCADDTGEDAFEDENPSPSLVSSNSVHLSNGCSKQTSECTSKSSAREEEAVSSLCFRSQVPSAQEVEASGKHASLEKSQEETCSEQARIILYHSLQCCCEAEQEHAAREPDMWLKLLEQNIAGDLEKNIRYEEDDEGGVVFVTFEMEVLGHACDIGVRDVDSVSISSQDVFSILPSPKRDSPVQEGEQVKDTQEWYDVEINLRHQLALRCVWWADECIVV